VTVAVYQLTSSPDAGYFQKQRQKNAVSKKLMDITTFPSDQELEMKNVSKVNSLIKKELKEIDRQAFEKFNVYRYRMN
jgi:hypothetical protein